MSKGELVLYLINGVSCYTGEELKNAELFSS